MAALIDCLSRIQRSKLGTESDRMAVVDAVKNHAKEASKAGDTRSLAELHMEGAQKFLQENLNRRKFIAEQAGVKIPEPKPEVKPSEPTAGTSNRVFTQTYGEGAVPSGTGVDVPQLLDNARTDIRSGTVDPYEVLSRTKADGIANAREYAVLAAEHERLVNEASAKQRANDPTAPEAVKAAEDFAKAMQPHKTAASDLMRSMQGDLNYDMGTQFGMNEYMKAELGREMTPKEVTKFKAKAEVVRQAETEVAKAVERADAKVQKKYARAKDISIEEAANRVKEWMKECQV